MLRLSVSKILCFEQCPFRYKLTYIDKIKSKVVPKQLVKGTQIHDVFDKSYDDKKLTIEQLKNNIRKQPIAIKHREHMNNFVKFNKRRMVGDKITLPLFKEVKLYDAKLHFAGIIDRVEINNGKLVVIDYKTGKVGNLKKHHFQLSIYKHLFEKSYNMKVDKWGIYYSKDDIELTEDVDNSIVAESIKKIVTTRLMIEQEQNWRPKPSFLCPWCEFYQNGLCNGNKCKDGNGSKPKNSGEKFWEDGN